MVVDAHGTMDAVVPLTFETGSILHGSSSRDELCHLCESWKDLGLKSNEMSEMLYVSASKQAALPECFAIQESSSCSSYSAIIERSCVARGRTEYCSALHIRRSSVTDTILSSTETMNSDHDDHGSNNHDPELLEQAYNFQRFECVQLALNSTVTSLASSTHLFWAQTAMNLETLVQVGLVSHFSVLVRDSHGSELELEADAESLRMWTNCEHACFEGHAVRALRVHADIDSLCAHAHDCTLCSLRAAHTVSSSTDASTCWHAWWCRAMCLAHYLVFLQRHASTLTNSASSLIPASPREYYSAHAPKDIFVPLSQHHGECDLDFLGCSHL